MTFVEYIRTKNYLDRITATRDSQRGKLSGKQFAQFSGSFEFEIEKLKKQLATFQENVMVSVVLGSVLCKSFQRTVPMQTRVRSNITLCGSLKASHIGPQPQFIGNSSFLPQDPWNQPHESLCEASA
jgi:hypothetical protein